MPRKNNFDPNSPEFEHGTPQAYRGKTGSEDVHPVKGCRCEKCTAAWREYINARRKLRYEIGLPEDDPRHGTKNGYYNWGCRCEVCKKAVSEYAHQLYIAKKAS